MNIATPAYVKKQNRTDYCSYSKIYILLTGFLLVMCAMVPETPMSSIVALVAFGVYLAYLIVTRPLIILKYGFYFFVVVASIVGTLSCEFTGDYLVEMRQYAGFHGSLPLLIASRWLFIVILEVYENRWGVDNSLSDLSASNHKRKGNWKHQMLMIANVGIFAGLCCAYLTVIAYPSFLMGVDRFVYASLVPSGVRTFLIGWITFMMFIPLYCFKNYKSILGIASVVIYILYLFWTGTKFGGYLYIVCDVLLVYYDRFLQCDIRKLAKAAIAFFASLILLVGVAVVAFSFTSEQSSVDFLTSRTAQQGQLWWATFADSDGEAHLDQAKVELLSIAKNEMPKENIGSNHGIYGVMYRTVPESVVDYKLSLDSRYTEAGYAVAYYCFGWLGPFAFSIVMALLIALLQNGFLFFLNSERVIEAFVAYRFGTFLRSALSMGLFGPFFLRSSIVMALVFVLMMLLDPPKKAKRKYLARPPSTLTYRSRSRPRAML